MNDRVNKLINVLTEMIEVFDKLLVAAHEKQKQMVLLDMNSLERTTKEEGELLDYMLVLEKNSGAIMHDINKVFFNTNSLVLKKLVELSKSNDIEGAEDIRKVYTRLIDVTGKLREVNEKNQNLAQFSIEMVRDTVRFICKSSTDKAKTTYEKTGRFDSTGSLLNLLDTSA
ncbi:MAG: flagellar export chaperone FlgN [Candidatus Anammoxibacter sp.]